MEQSIEYPMLKNTSVVDLIKDWITDQMIKGNVKPGDKLPTETELCAHLGASRNSIREAIKQLEAYGVVYIKRAEGTFVSSEFEPKMMEPLLYSMICRQNSWRDIVDLRRAIDIGTLFILLDKEIQEEDLLPLSEALAALEESVDCEFPDVLRVTEADSNFHDRLIELGRNPQLSVLFGFVNRMTMPSREETTRAVIAAGKIKEYKDLHRQIFNVIVSGDKSSIETVIKNHYIFWEKYMERQ